MNRLAQGEPGYTFAVEIDDGSELGFYQKMGYRIVGHLEDYQRGTAITGCAKTFRSEMR